jgi:hypothetical protein
MGVKTLGWLKLTHSHLVDRREEGTQDQQDSLSCKTAKEDHRA